MAIKLKIMKIEKEFIPYEQALALKQLGFDEPCLTYYFSDGVFNDATEEDDTLYPGDPRFYSDTNSSLAKYLEDELKYKAIAAPLYQQAFRWFRINYNLDSICRQIELNGRSYWIINVIDSEDRIKGYSYFAYSYEQAVIACLEKLIEIVKSQKQ